ncbi:MAG TPA: GAP family protein [Ornithinibacter sp.]|nr:GAP family protein [Ornithinibacter sp.]
MNGLSGTLGSLLPAALGVALSPVPIIATVLMLMSGRPRRTAPAFALGWVIGLVVVMAVVLVAVGKDGLDTSGTSDTTYWVKLVLGMLFLALGLRTWRQRPHPGEAAEPPAWMGRLETISALAALGLGAALSGVNPKNLALTASGAVAIASGDLSTSQTVACVVVFVVLASLLVVGPVVAFLVLGDRTAGPLQSLKTFMEVHNAAIMTVLLGVLGLSMLGQGLGGLLG